jgi:transcriptional regulator with XRE-family HTH domain
MSLHEEIGALLAEVRESAKMTQGEIAKGLGVHQSRVSRMESGEGATNRDEYTAYLDLIPSDEAKRLKRILAVEWKHLPQPHLRHPDLNTLIEAEKALKRLYAFKSGDTVPQVLVGQAEMLFRRLLEFGEFLLDLHHSIAYVGDIGVGKTTAACRQAGLVISPTTAADLKGVILDTGGGRVTLCDVCVQGGTRFSIKIDPLPDEEVYRLVAEFCRSLQESGDGTTTSKQTDFKLPEETERALRNMAGLMRTRRRADIKAPPVDPAVELAKTFGTPDEFRAEVSSRLTLWRRTRRTIEFEGADELAGRHWLKDTFAAINNGRHPEFSMPGQITVTVPFPPYPGTAFALELVDTRGVDGSAIRPDIVAQLKDRRTVTVLCSKFNSAPDVSLHHLLKHITETEVDPTLNSRVVVLVLARSGEALAMRDDSGAAAQDILEGYDIKRNHVEDALSKLGLDGIDVHLFDSSSDDPEELTRFLIRKVEVLRKVQADGVDAVVSAVDQMLENVQRAQALAALEVINNELKIFANRHKALKDKRKPVHSRLIAAINDRHPRTVWAVTRRNGEFWNFNIYQHLGDGAAAEAKRRSALAVEGLREIIRNKLVDSSLATSHSFLKQLLDDAGTWEADFVKAARHHAVEVYRPNLSSAGALWSECEDKYGHRRDYRAEVAKEIENWFDENDNLDDKLEQLIQRAWRISFIHPLRKAAGEILMELPEAA